MPINGISKERGYFITIPNWHPTNLNRIIGVHYGKRRRLKESDVAMVAAYSRYTPAATGPRRLSVTLYGWKKGKLPDSDNMVKSLRDALVRCRLLIDDSPSWCCDGDLVFVRCNLRGTVIILEEIPACEINRNAVTKKIAR